MFSPNPPGGNFDVKVRAHGLRRLHADDRHLAAVGAAVRVELAGVEVPLDAGPA
jgi:hypothetical protein